MIRELLQRGLERIAGRGRPDPGAERPSVEAQLRELLEAYGAEIRGEEESPRRSDLWIFARGVDHEAYLQAAVAIVEEATSAARWEGYAAAAEPEAECACVCREHRERACPVCQRVEQCEVHADGDPSRVSPRWREEHP